MSQIVTVYDFTHVWHSDGKAPNYKPTGPALCGYVETKIPRNIWQTGAEKLINERCICEKCRLAMKNGL